MNPQDPGSKLQLTIDEDGMDIDEDGMDIDEDGMDIDEDGMDITARTTENSSFCTGANPDPQQSSAKGEHDSKGKDSGRDLSDIEDDQCLYPCGLDSENKKINPGNTSVAQNQGKASCLEDPCKISEQVNTDGQDTSATIYQKVSAKSTARDSDLCHDESPSQKHVTTAHDDLRKNSKVDSSLYVSINLDSGKTSATEGESYAESDVHYDSSDFQVGQCLHDCDKACASPHQTLSRKDTEESVLNHEERTCQNDRTMLHHEGCDNYSMESKFENECLNANGQAHFESATECGENVPNDDTLETKCTCNTSNGGCSPTGMLIHTDPNDSHLSCSQNVLPFENSTLFGIDNPAFSFDQPLLVSEISEKKDFSEEYDSSSKSKDKHSAENGSLSNTNSFDTSERLFIFIPVRCFGESGFTDDNGIKHNFYLEIFPDDFSDELYEMDSLQGDNGGDLREEVVHVVPEQDEESRDFSYLEGPFPKVLSRSRNRRRFINQSCDNCDARRSQFAYYDEATILSADDIDMFWNSLAQFAYIMKSTNADEAVRLFRRSPSLQFMFFYLIVMLPIISEFISYLSDTP